MEINKAVNSRHGQPFHTLNSNCRENVATNNVPHHAKEPPEIWPVKVASSVKLGSVFV